MHESRTRLRIVLVDDHQLVREGLAAMLRSEPDLDVVGEAADARAAYAVVDAARPDVVVMDLALPGVSGVAAVRELLRRDASRKVLVLSMHSTEEYVTDALAAGARGYALKDQSSETVAEAIRAVARGERYLSPRIARFVTDELGRPVAATRRVGGPLEPLSAREREVFELLVKGLSNDGIAGELCISVKTVETHRAHVLKKLRLHSMTDLVRFAARHHLIAQ